MKKMNRTDLFNAKCALYLTDAGFSDFENDITELIEQRMEVDRSDAQGILEVQDEQLMALYNGGNTDVEDVYNILFPADPLAPTGDNHDVDYSRNDWNNEEFNELCGVSGEYDNDVEYTEAEAAEAIEARKNGDYDNTQLQRMGALSVHEFDDIDFIQRHTKTDRPGEFYNPDFSQQY